MNEATNEQRGTSPRRFRPYPEYKDSGVEWLGEIPAGWEVKRLKHVALLQGGYAFKSDAFQSDGISVVRMNNLRRGLLDLTEAARIAPSECIEAFALNEEDLLLGMSGSLGETGSLGNYAIVRSADLPCQLNQRVGRFRFSSKLRREFLFYFIAAAPFTEPLIADSTGTAQFNISPETVGEVDLGLPPTTEQAKIAAFLDRETARIDALVAKKERLIELLQEKRTALITRAVTKGLYPNVPMKDSGVEWLGEIPAHWELMKTTWVFSIGSGTTPRSDDPGYYGGETPWITTAELRESVVLSTEKNVTEEALREHSSLKVHPKGSVAVAMYGATIGRLGILGVPAAVNQACCVFSDPQRIETWFWFYWLQMRRPHLISLGYGGGQPNLSQDLLKSIRVPTPRLSEQRAITAFLDRETARIAALVAKVREASDRLKELRTALISAAVTGKIDVREEVA